MAGKAVVGQPAISSPVNSDKMQAALEKLMAMQDMKETSVQITVPSDAEGLELTLSSNLVIKSIKPSSCVLYKLIIGDQILNIHGVSPSTADDALELVRKSRPKFPMLVNRPTNREPVPPGRAAAVQLRRQPGYAYFVVHVQRVEKVHLGLGIRAYRNKVIVNRTDENSLAAFAYLVGDVILDVNSERVCDVLPAQKKMVESLVKYGCVNTIVERPESSIAIHNTRVMSNFLSSTGTTDPPLPGDVVCIAQREIVRYRANMNKATPKSVYRHVEPAKDYDTSKDTEHASETVYDSNETTPRVSGFQKFTESLRRKKGRKITFNLKPTEVPIASDVQNTMFLQKLPSNSRSATALTFMPKMFLQGLSKGKNSDTTDKGPGGNNTP